MTLSEVKKAMSDLENRIHAEGYPDVFIRKQSGSGSDNVSFKLCHADYSEPIAYSGSLSSYERQVECLTYYYENTVKGNPKYS